MKGERFHVSNSFIMANSLYSDDVISIVLIILDLRGIVAVLD